MCRENLTWSATPIHGELLKLGINISETSVSKYMAQPPQAAVADLAHLPGESCQAVGSIDFFTASRQATFLARQMLSSASREIGGTIYLVIFHTVPYPMLPPFWAVP
jgi:hypothetical protein